jgi:hypothetical protein
VGGAVINNQNMTPQSASSGHVMTILLLLAAIGICLNSIHSVLIKPIGVGVILLPGTVKSKCGIIGWIPNLVKDVTKTLLEPFKTDIHTSNNLLNCMNEYLEVDHHGEIKITDQDGNLMVHLMGSTCDTTPKATSSCVKGVIFQDNKTVKIGSKVVKRGVVYYYDRKHVTAATSRKLSPWPFAEEPKITLSPIKRSK